MSAADHADLTLATLSATGLSSATNAQEPGSIWSDLVPPKGNLVAGSDLQDDKEAFRGKLEELEQNRCLPWNFLTMDISAGEREATTTLLDS